MGIVFDLTIIFGLFILFIILKVSRAPREVK